jgi:uncharacterized membrane protein
MKKILKKVGERIPSRFTLSQWLLIALVFSLSLLAIRIIKTGYLSYGFLAWNLFLAYVPYFISEWLSKHPQMLASRVKLIAIVFIWILFMPNSFYILTDLFHLNNMSKGDSWYDLTLILSFAWNGILFGILSIYKMELLLKKAKGKFIAAFIIYVVMWLNAFGIYIGRFLRFNSWDIFINPFSLISGIVEIIFNPYDYRYVWAMCFCFAFFMAILYYTTKRLSDVFKNS